MRLDFEGEGVKHWRLFIATYDLDT